MYNIYTHSLRLLICCLQDYLFRVHPQTAPLHQEGTKLSQGV